MTTNWQYGPADAFWMEKNPPSGNAYQFHIDMDDIPVPSRNLLLFLDKLRVIRFGCFYETCEMIRIKDA